MSNGRYLLIKCLIIMATQGVLSNSVSACGQPTPNTKLLSFKGTAYKKDTDEILYFTEIVVENVPTIENTERGKLITGHSIQNIETIFRDKDNNLIAKKWTQLNSKAATIPAYTLYDFRNHYYQYGQLSGSNFRIARHQNQQVKKDHIKKKKSQDYVMDLGFDSLIKQQWDKLKDGKAIRFTYVLASELDKFSFKLQRIKAPSERIKGTKGNLVQFKMTIDNSFLAMFVKPMILTYDSSYRRLIQYEGITDLRDINGDQIVARLEYEYPD